MSESMPESDENPFLLDSAFVLRQKEARGKAAWKEKGNIYLPVKKDGERIKKVVFEVEGSLAEEIQQIHLQNNPVKTVVGAEKLKGLKIVRCGKCGLDSVPRWIGNLTAVEQVFCYNSGLKEIPSWLVGIPTLRKICASDIKRLPVPSLGESLKVLAMKKCDLRSLPDDFFHHALEEVYLSRNEGKSMRENCRTKSEWKTRL